MKTLARLGWMALLAGAGLLCLRPTVAEANRDVIAVGGGAEQRDLDTVTNAVTTALRDAGWELPAKALTRKETAALLACLKADAAGCAPETMRARGIRQALVITADGDTPADGSLVLVLTAKVLATQPENFVVLQRRCEPCTEDTLSAASTALTRTVLQELAVRAGRTLISIRSNPEGANIVLDGQPIGATPMVAKTFPGSHVVQLEKSGYVTTSRPVEAIEGTTAELSLDLQSSSRPPSGSRVIDRADSQKADEGWWHLPTGLLAGGALAAAGGVALIYLGQRDGEDIKYIHERSTTLGIVAVVLGGGAAGYGGYLLHRGPSVSGPIVSATGHGAVIGWAGSF